MKRDRTRYGRLAAVAMSVWMALALGACSKEGGRAAYGASAEDTQKAPTAAAPASGATAAESTATAPKVLDYGPREVAAGKAFNPQPDGSSALWIKLDQSMEGTDAVISLDGRPLHTSISGDVVTAVVPMEFIQHPSTQKLEVSRTVAGQVVRSGPSSFVVR